jgi:hypothetical protein
MWLSRPEVFTIYDSIKIQPKPWNGSRIRRSSKVHDCADFVEMAGRCQHPIIEDSGPAVFYGVTGRRDLEDDLAAGNFPYMGYVR